MPMHPPQEDEHGQPFVKVDWNINDIRLLHNAITFYADNSEDIQESEEHIAHMKRVLYAMLMEFQYRS